MKSNIKKNYLFNVSYQLFALLVPLITTPYISRVLSVEGIGVYSYTYSMVRYFWLLAALGSSTLGTRTIGVFQDDEDKRSYEFWNLFSLRFILSFIMGILYIGYIAFVADNKIISLIQGIYLLGVMFDITWLFQGMEDFKKVTLKNFFIKILNVIYIFVFIKTPDDLAKYVFGLAFFTLIGNLSLWINLHKYVNKIKIKSLKPFKDSKLVMQLFIPSVATQIFFVLDKTMIGWFSNGSLENGYYEQALKIVDMTLVIITTLSTVMIPRIAQEYKKGNKSKIQGFLDKSFKFVFMLAIPMSIGIISVSSIFVPWFFGPEYNKSIYILCILSLLYVFMGINSLTGTQYLVSTNQQNKHTKFLLIGGTCNVILNLILIPNLYSIGAAISSVTGELIITILEINYLNKTNQYDIKKVFKYARNYVVAGVIMLSVLLLLKTFFNNNILLLFIMIASGFVIYILILLMEKDSLVLEIINMLKKKIIRRVN